MKTSVMNSEKLPLVSCLCVTRNKPQKLKRAIDCFLAQTYQNKELLIVYEDDDEATKAFLEKYKNQYNHIYILEVESKPKLTLGELRNISVLNCNGEYFCQWDDDDWYHCERLTVQVNAVVNNFQTACLLTNWIIFDEKDQQAYFSMFRLWEGTILCKSDILHENLAYPSLSKLEDSIFINLLVEQERVIPVVAPNLYIYVVHKSNTWNRAHFEQMFSYAQKLPATTSQLVEDILKEEVSIEEGSRILSSKQFLQELKYFQVNNISIPNKYLLQTLAEDVMSD